MDKLKMHSPNLVDSNIEKIEALFPNCVTEAQGENGELKKAIDFDLLKQELSQVIVEGEQERYRLDWVGKKEAILTANAPIAKTLRPCREESVNFDITENLFIEGDNLEALKLLQENYLGKVKIIYIDPPYNTGNDFIYEDDFAESTDAFFEKSNQVDEEGNRLIANIESNGRFHSDWLSMMYSRLKLARNLLTDDGFITVSIDQIEINNLKKVLDEVFGAKNFISDLIWKKKQGGGNDSNLVVVEHEYIILYAKDIFKCILNLDKNYQLDDNLYPFKDENGDYGLVTLDKSSIRFSDSLVFPIYDNNGKEYFPRIVKGKQSCWRWGKKKVDAEYEKLVFKNDKVYTKYYRPIGITPKSLLIDPIYGRTESGSDDIKDLFDNTKPFSYPKPVALLKHLIGITTNKDEDIILDFFAGSSTTAHAVMQLNSEDNGNRRFIMVQLPEKTDEKSDAYKAKYNNIAEISKERIRRAGKKILEDNASKEGIENLDIGFRVLKIDSTNMKDVYYTPDAIKQADILDLADHIKEDRTSEDLLFQVMLDWGLELSLPIERKIVQGKEIFYVAGNSLVACFDELNFDVVDEVAKDHPLRFVTAEKAIHLDHDKTNIKERFKQLSPDTEVKFL
ncbi:site-specific DNA-methyltransferase [Acinetobacter seifertii]|uniref:site-specific DNA-methyltransferase n=1 Tax=Acinetobacter seifertii TaxID=1530123 RepID=UPI0024DE08DE|nr:site-specific DNA-methyltransferase [Acinetobacter seifertii]